MMLSNILRGALAAVVALGLMSFGPPASVARVQSQLAALALQQPEAQVRVIVQKVDRSGAAEALARQLGATLHRDLGLISAFVAELPARQAVRLAHSPAVKWISLDAPVAQSSSLANTSLPANYFLDTTGARRVWGLGLQGQGVTVAVVDSGISQDTDFGQGGTTANRLLRQISFATGSNTINDIYGHGTHVAGIVGGSGADSRGAYAGMAPGVNLLGIKIADGTGRAYESDVVAALQWIYDNRAASNIRVVNLSVNATLEQSYHTGPINAAVEILWFNGVVVVVSAGNKGSGYDTIKTAPANDPFVITVGAADEMATSSLRDDVMAAYSAYGVTLDGVSKPDLLAPGSNIYSVLSKFSSWSTLDPSRLAGNGEYFRLSGTSMAAPMVAGAAALLLQDEPNLTPDQVKYRLLNSGRTLAVKEGKTLLYSLPYLDAYAAVTGTSTQSANTGTSVSHMLTTGIDPMAWSSVSWSSVSWSSVSWSSVSWSSVSWSSVSWSSTYWGR